MLRPRDFFLIPLMFVVTGTGLVWGGYATYVSLRNWSPTEVTCAEFAAHPPEARWLRLTECAPDFERMGVETIQRGATSSSEVTAVYVPLHDRHSDGHGRATIVVTGDDSDLLALGEMDPPHEAFEHMAAQLDGPIDGLAISVLSMSARRREALRGLHIGLADDFVVIDRSSRPQPLWFALGMLAVGIAGAARIRRQRARARRNRPAPLARATIVAE